MDERFQTLVTFGWMVINAEAEYMLKLYLIVMELLLVHLAEIS